MPVAGIPGRMAQRRHSAAGRGAGGTQAMKASRRRTWLPRRAFLEWAGLCVVLSVLAVVLGMQVGLGRMDRQLYDFAQSLRKRPVPAEVVIVTIDDESVAALGRWPWRRAVLATLLHHIGAAGPRAVGLDVILSEPDVRDPQGDAVLAQVMKTVPGLVLPVVAVARGGPNPQPLLPIPEFLAAGVRLAHTHVEPDEDGVVRSIFLQEGTAREQWPAFSLAVGGDALPFANRPGDRRPPGETAQGAWLRDYWVHIDYAGPPGTVKRIPAVQILTGQVDPAELRGKYVFIGATAMGLGDAYPTPVTGQSELMPGVEIHAQALSALLQGRATGFASPLGNALYTLLPVLLALAGFVFLAPRMVLVMVALLIADSLVAAGIILAFAQQWYPPAAAVLILVVAFPVWSWRRLEAVVHFLAQQFEQLESEPAIVPGKQVRLGERFSDVLGRQIGTMRVAADRLREARRFIADSLDSLPVATLVSDTDERVLLANRLAAQLFESGGTAAVDLRGRVLPELLGVLAPARAGLWAEAQQALGERAHAEIEFKDGRGRSLLLDCVPCLDTAGERSGLIVTLVDISTIRDAQRRRDETLAFLSHDIRSPQASMLAAIELHQLRPEKFPAGRVLEQVEQQARATIELADQFIQVSRAETQDLKLAACDLADIGREAVQSVQAQAQAKSIQVEFAGGEPVPVQADRALLVRVIVNLVNNAVKYSPPETTVTVSASVSGGRARCGVRDQGYGISPEDQKRLFERFARFSQPGQPQEKGIGLGLAFVKTVIDRHRGEMQVTSEPGKGSEFGFVLPLGQ